MKYFQQSIVITVSILVFFAIAYSPISVKGGPPMKSFVVTSPDSRNLNSPGGCSLNGGTVATAVCYEVLPNDGRLKFTIDFNRPVDPASVTVGGAKSGTLNLAWENRNQPGQIAYENGGQRLIFTTDSRTPPCSHMVLTMNEIASMAVTQKSQLLDGDYDGNPGGLYTITFQNPPC